MELIKDIVKTVVRGWEGKKTACPEEAPEFLLKKALTKRELAHIKFNYFKSGILFVNVDSSSWLFSLSLKKEALLEDLKKKNIAVKDIRFRIGDIK